MSNVKSDGGLKKKMTIEIPSDLISEGVEKRLIAIGRRAKIKGFRPGKVPSNVVKQHYGAEAHQETVSELIQKSYIEAIDENKLRPAGSPTITPKDNKDNNLSYTASFEVFPDIKLKGLNKIIVEKPDVNITDQDLEDMLLKLRKQKRSWRQTDKKSSEGYQVNIDFKGTLNGELIKGGEGSNVPVVLGEGQMLPDFEKALYGLKAGEDKSFKVKFPKKYHSEELADKKVDFVTTVNYVEEEVLPELNEDFVKEFGIKDGDIDKLKLDVKRNMEREVSQRITQDIKEQVMSSLIKTNKILIPNVMKENEILNMQKESMRQMGIEDDDKMPPAEDFTEMAEKRVRLGLLLSQVIEDNSLTVDSKRVQNRVEEMCAGYENPSEMIERYLGNKQFLTQIHTMALEEQAIDLLAEKGKEKIKKVSFNDYMNG